VNLTDMELSDALAAVQAASETYDVIWFGPKHEGWAMDHVRRLPENEVRERMLDAMQGLNINPDMVTMIDEEGHRRPGKCSCVWANSLGSKTFRPGPFKPGPRGLYRLRDFNMFQEIHVLVECNEDDPGIAVGNFKPTVYESKQWQREAEADAIREEARIKALTQRDNRTLWERFVWWLSGLLKVTVVFPITLCLNIVSWLISAVAWIVFDLPAAILCYPAVLYRRKVERDKAEYRESRTPMMRSREVLSLAMSKAFIRGSGVGFFTLLFNYLFPRRKRNQKDK